MTADQILNTLPFGISVAASARVGNALGARSPARARLTSHVAALLAAALGALVAIVLVATRTALPRLFTSSPPVIALTRDVLPYVAAFQVADGIVGACSGALRGMGRQHVGAAANLVGYYAGALPGGIWLAWHGWGLAGLWVGQCAALYLVGAIEWVIVARADWVGEVRRAFARMDGGGGGGGVEGMDVDVHADDQSADPDGEAGRGGSRGDSKPASATPRRAHARADELV